jgi:hypothetical protein
LHELDAALDDHKQPLSAFADVSQLMLGLRRDLDKIPRDSAHAGSFDDVALPICETFLTTFNDDAVRREIRAGLEKLGVKIDALPSTYPGLAKARAERQTLIDEVNAEPLDGSFAGPLATVDAFVAWWAEQARQDHSFLALKQICDVLGLYADLPGGLAEINPDFVRQLAAMQMLRDDYALCLTDALPLWLPQAGGADQAVTVQAKSDLAAVIQERADCLRKAPKLFPLRAEHFGQIADLTSLRADPGPDNFPPFVKPTHTLRFVESCFKVAHSEFSVGELAFLYLNRHDVPFEDDPFHVETDLIVLAAQPFADKFSELTDASLLRLQQVVRGAAYGSMNPARPDGKGSDGHPSWIKNERKLLSTVGYADDDLARLDRVFTEGRQPRIWPDPGAAVVVDEIWQRLAASLGELGYQDLAALQSLLTQESPSGSC